MDSIWRRWVDAPQRLRFRRVLFQLHLWLGLALGLYIALISITGSAVVFRRELNLWLVPRSVPSTVGVRLTGDELRSAAERAYAEHRVTAVREGRRADRPASIYLERDGKESERLFDPYRGVDMGLAYPRVLRFVEWLVDLHDNLLTGTTGRAVNGIGGALVGLLVVSGAVLWWPGRHRWLWSLVVGRPSASRQFLSRLHSALGFWSFALLLVWAATAVYFAFPAPFESLIDAFDADLTDTHRPGEPLLLELVKLHFGRFGGLGVRVSWVLLGLVPAVLFVTGLLLWWMRVGRRALRGRRAPARAAAAVATRAALAKGVPEAGR